MPGRNAALDAVRGIAILLVILSHLFKEHFVVCGYMGVDLFFVLSGFLIGGNLIDRVHESRYFSDFYTRRIFRIVPLYYLVVLLAPLPLSQSLWHFLTFTQNFWWAAENQMHGWDSVTWSLAVEEQFYLVAPLLIRLVPLRQLPIVLIGLALTAPLFRAMSTTVGTVFLMPCRIDSFCVGILAVWLLRFSKPGTGLLLTTFGVSGLGYVIVFLTSANRASVQMWTAGYTLEAVFFASLLVILALQGWQGNRVLQWFGVRAYGLYLIHTMMLTWTGSVVFGLAASLVLAEISWRWLESPLIDLGRRINTEYRLRKQAGVLSQSLL